MKKIYLDFEDYWANGEHPWTSFNRDIAKEEWDRFEPTILASRDDYKNAYVLLMNERLKDSNEIFHAMLDYMDLHKKENAPTFYKWYMDKLSEPILKENEALRIQKD